MTWYDHEREEARALPPKPYSISCPLPCPDLRGAVEAYLLGRGLDAELAEDNGWYPSRSAGDKEPRVVIPASSLIPENKYWQARKLTDEGDAPRYQSPHHVNRGDAVIAVYPDYNRIPLTVLVEGPTDALAAAGTGFVGIAFMGNTPPDAAFATARYLARGKIVVVADHGALKEAVKIWQRWPGAVLEVPYPWKDLAEMPQDERRKLLR